MKKKHLIRQLEEDNIREEEAVAYLKELQESNVLPLSHETSANYVMEVGAQR